MTQRRPLRPTSFVNFALNHFKDFNQFNPDTMQHWCSHAGMRFKHISVQFYLSCSEANAVESRSFTIGLFMETKLFRLFWFKISDVCYKTQRNTLLPDHLKRGFINLQPVLTQKQWKIRQSQLKKKWEIAIPLELNDWSPHLSDLFTPIKIKFLNVNTLQMWNTCLTCIFAQWRL